MCVFVTCTFDSLSNETPHEVGTVLTPVRTSECMNLVKETLKKELMRLNGIFTTIIIKTADLVREIIKSEIH